MTSLLPLPRRVGQGVYLIEENDAGVGQLGFAEDLADPTFALAHVFVEQRWPFDRDKVGLALAGDGFGQQSLAHAGRATEQNAFGWSSSGLGKQICILQRPFDTFAQGS